MHAGSAPAPTRYGPLLALMREYGWSWADLREAPADLVEEAAIRLEAERHWTTEKAKYDASMREQGIRR